MKFRLTLKVPITTAADEKFCDIFPNFKKKIRYLISDDSHVFEKAANLIIVVCCKLQEAFYGLKALSIATAMPKRKCIVQTTYKLTYHALFLGQQKSLTLCLMVIFPCFFFVVCWIFFFKSTLSKNCFRNTIRVANSLDLDQAWYIVGPDLGPNCLHRLSADDTYR